MNASGEASKQGFDPGDLDALVLEVQELHHVQVKGLMTMAALQEPEMCRPTFTRLRQGRRPLAKNAETAAYYGASVHGYEQRL